MLLFPLFYCSTVLLFPQCYCSTVLVYPASSNQPRPPTRHYLPLLIVIAVPIFTRVFKCLSERLFHKLPQSSISTFLTLCTTFSCIDKTLVIYKWGKIIYIYPPNNQPYISRKTLRIAMPLCSLFFCFYVSATCFCNGLLVLHFQQ